MNRPLADGSKRTEKNVLEVESNKFARLCNPSFPELTFTRKGSPLGLFNCAHEDSILFHCRIAECVNSSCYRNISKT
jgi:hypothetical protein